MSPIQTPNTPWFAATVGLVGLIVGFAAASGVGDVLPSPAPSVPPSAFGDAPPPAPEPTYEPADTGGNVILGSADAPVTIIEFTDYQCPFCGRHYEQTFGLIKEEYVDTGRVQYVVRDFPLQPKTEKVAEASKCAAVQGKFWEMHSALNERKDEWATPPDPTDALKQIAADLGVNADTFAACLDNGEQTAAVQADRAAGQASGITGTPGFWVLGPGGQAEQISGAYPYDTFKAVFDAMLN